MGRAYGWVRRGPAVSSPKGMIGRRFSWTHEHRRCESGMSSRLVNVLLTESSLWLDEEQRKCPGGGMGRGIKWQGR
jgi:hypothetical protein